MDFSSVSVEDFQDRFNDTTDTDAKDFDRSAPQSSKDHPRDEDSSSLTDSAHGHPSSTDDEAVFDGPPSQHSSPETSQDSSDEEISALGSVSGYSPSRHVSDVHRTPSKPHSPFHHPSSVRAMQLDTTPPHLTTPLSQRKRFHTPSRQTSTPRSTRSGHRSTPSKLMNSSPMKTVKKEHPLVLLHVTLLAMSHNYSLELLEAVLPQATFANWKLLREKINPTVLHRGILIPHPRDDYDLLEERILESLGLKEPRILKCGHFHLSSEEEADIEASEGEEEEEDADLADADTCEDCGRRIRDGRFGDSGTGSKRWDIRVFAANGLMRAGAWSAAWKEMERVDVEIDVWMEDSMKRELELRSEEEQEQAKREQGTARKEEGIAGLDDERLREIYGQGTPRKEKTQDDIDGLSYGTPFTQHSGPDLPRSPSQSPFKFEFSQRQRNDIRFWDLLRNYFYLAAQDSRNILIWVLTATVLFLALRSSEPKPSVSFAPLDIPSSSIPSTFSASTTEVARELETSLADSYNSILSDSATVIESSVRGTPSPRSADSKFVDSRDEEVQGGTQSESGSITEAADEVLREFLDN